MNSLLNSDRPLFLYKFRPLFPNDSNKNEIEKRRAEEILLENKLYFSSPLDFNDPFDWRPTITIQNCEEKDLTSLVPEIQEGVWRYILKSIREGNKMLECEAENSIYQSFSEKLKNWGVCCFFEQNNKSKANNLNMLNMWNQYSNGHRGYCLKFQVSDESFYNKLYLVNYSENRPQFDLCDFLKNLGSEEYFNLTCLTKHSGLEYEQEWRIIEPKGTGNYSFPKKLLIGIILGCQISKSDKDFILGLIERRNQPNFEKFEARPKKGLYELEFVPI